MSCMLCLEEQNFLYNLCDVCKNCLVCKSCMRKEDTNRCDVCFNCREPFKRTKRRINCKDVLYFVIYFRYLITHILSMIVLPNLNMSIYFPEEKYLERHPYVIQNQITFIVFMNYINISSNTILNESDTLELPPICPLANGKNPAEYTLRT